MSIHTPLPFAAPRTMTWAPGVTYILFSDDVSRETQVGFAWSDALDALWSGDFDGTPHLIAMDLTQGTAIDVTNAALIDLSDRALRDGETPSHLEPHLIRAGLPVAMRDAGDFGRRKLHAMIDQTGGRFSTTGCGRRA